MNKTFLLFKHEFFQAIKKAGFIILTFLIPVLALLTIGVVDLVSKNVKPPVTELTIVGYVDLLGISTDQNEQGFVKLVNFPSEELAVDALIGGEISEYILIPADYLTSGSIQRYTLKNEINTPPGFEYILESFKTLNLLKDNVSSDLIT